LHSTAYPERPGALVHPKKRFLDVAVAARREGMLMSDDLEARLLEDPERAAVVAGGAGVQRPVRDAALRTDSGSRI
jgi:hypothetical protein